MATSTPMNHSEPLLARNLSSTSKCAASTAGLKVQLLASIHEAVVLIYMFATLMWTLALEGW